MWRPWIRMHRKDPTRDAKGDEKKVKRKCVPTTAD